MWMKKESEMKHVELPEEVGKIVDLGKPSLEALSWLLRHKEMWPRGFEWIYRDCHSCAMGLAWTLWRESIDLPVPEVIAKVFFMEESAACRIFINGAFKHQTLDVTPEMIADDIDEYLAGRK